MILGIILLTASILSVGYAMYNSKVENKNDNTQELQYDGYMDEQQETASEEVGEDAANKLLKQLVEHLDAYEQYYEQKVGECHNCILLTEQCMALAKGCEERLALYEIMKHDVTEFNRYMRVMKPFSQNELNQGGNIALELKNSELLNTEQAALLATCGGRLVPYVISEQYVHDLLESNLEYRAELISRMKSEVIQRKHEYAEAHREMLEWEHEYAHIKAETIMSEAELLTARLDMEMADHALAKALAEHENVDGQVLVNAYAEAAEQALILKEAEINAAKVDMVKMQLETARLDMEAARLEQVLIEHQQPGEELHPNLPPGARIVPGNNTPPPLPTGGGGGSSFLEWVGSGIC